ncbi:uncharacterized protein VP01_1702g4 [Puccinia sorghi]|uniref:Uncharacterized protein n=1 Tax=Puccinia sorghi TaxID=27349 RepID=A0A0L6VG83_9BASI|nr:uncharacterized protein VP01_1702g4 [Puccinia sorghi]
MSGAPLAESESDKDLPPELPDPLEGLPVAACNASLEEASVAWPLPGASHATTPVKPPVAATGWSLGVGRPPAITATVPRQCGCTKDNPKKDELVNQMMMMMYKASKQAATWQREQQERAEQTCLEDFPEQQAQADIKEQALKEELAQACLAAEPVRFQVQLYQDTIAQACLAAEQVHFQVQLDQDTMELHTREAEMRATQKDEDRKIEQEEARQLCIEKVRRFEASQAASENSRMAFESAMLVVMENMGRGSASSN